MLCIFNKQVVNACFKGAKETLYASILPGTAFINALVGDIQSPKGSVHKCGAKYFFIVCPDVSWKTISADTADNVPH